MQAILVDIWAEGTATVHYSDYDISGIETSTSLAESSTLSRYSNFYSHHHCLLISHWPEISIDSSIYAFIENLKPRG